MPTNTSAAAAMKLRVPLPRLKTTADHIAVRDNVAVRRTIRGHEEICLATVIEIKEAPISDQGNRGEEPMEVDGDEDGDGEVGVEMGENTGAEVPTTSSTMEEEDQKPQPNEIPPPATPEEEKSAGRSSSKEPSPSTAVAIKQEGQSPMATEEGGTPSHHKLYYVHYNGLDRRLDEWVDKSRIVDDESEYRPALTPAVDSISNKKLTRSQRRFQEEWNHLHKEFELDATTAKLEREHEERTKVKNIDIIQFGDFEIDTW